MRRQNPSRKFTPALICFATAFGVRCVLASLYFRVATGLDKLSGFELFVTVWLCSVRLSPDGLRRYRGKTIRRVRAGCLRAHADRSTVVDHSAVSPPNLCLAWRYAKLSAYQQSPFCKPSAAFFAEAIAESACSITPSSFLDDSANAPVAWFKCSMLAFRFSMFAGESVS